MDNFFLILFAVLNVATFLIYGLDKIKARRGAWRIPESTLLGLAVIGGSLGAAFGMYAFRHKTKHARFTIGIPVIIIVQVALYIWLR